MELDQYFAVVKRWWWLMVACVLVATVSSYLGTLQMPRIYQATTTVMVGQAVRMSDPSNQDLYIGRQLAQTYAEMVKRRPVLEGAAEALGLEYVPSPGDISTRQVAGTQLLEISVRDTNPERARVLADEIARQLILRSPAGNEDQQRQSFVEEQLADLQAKIQATQQEIEEEEAQLEAANSARAIQQYQANINALEQKLSNYQSNYASLLTNVEGGTNYISIFESAATPRTPISPNVEQTVLLAAAIGLTLAVGGAFLIEYLDDTIKTPDDVDRVIDLPILGGISRIQGEEYAEKLVTAREPRSPIAEAYRVLRTNIQFSSVDDPTRTLMVTSPGPTEGKSITLANLAVVLAQSGRKVVVVDTDLRRPVLHRAFDVAKSHGLSDVILTSNPGLEEHLQATAMDNLWVLPSGSLPPNPAELLGSERFKGLIEELKERADVILFDSPPVLAVTDAAVLSTRVDGVLLINEAGRTRRQEARQAVEELQRVGANLLGVVLNRLSRRNGGYYYYYYYYRSDDGTRKRRRRPSLLERLIPFLDRDTGEVEE